MKGKEYVWYACYGSNMDGDRFLKYIQGGKLVINGNIKEYSACLTDREEPKDSRPYIILNRKFYFAKESKTWNRCGVGFIKNKEGSKAFAKLYLISKPQFSHLFVIENARKKSEVDFDKILKDGFQNFNYNFYNQIILLDRNYGGYPIVTFTNKDKLEANEPFEDYLKLVKTGLKQTHKLSDIELFGYLQS